MYSLVINDNDNFFQSDLAGSLNENPTALQDTLENPSASPDTKSTNDELMAQSVTGVLWDGIVAPAGRAAISGVVDAVTWGAAGAAAMEHDIFDQSPAAQEEARQELQKQIDEARRKGCRAAGWGLLYCAFGQLGPMMLPGVYEWVSDACQCLSFTKTPPRSYLDGLNN